MHVINQITSAIQSVEGIRLLHVDPGKAANRTVVTFVGSPEAVCEAAFRGAKTAGELIDMRHQHGTHPRIGATDVLPLIPVSGITLESCAELARKLARRLADEAGIPCYCYEAAALKPEHRNLADCRSGEYESLQEKLSDPCRRPDMMPPGYSADPFSPSVQKTGCTVVGARHFLIAVNWNLNTTSVPIAQAIACDVRQRGRALRQGDPDNGPVVKDADGKTVMVPGSLKCTKAIGWFIEEYGIAQVSMNMTNINVTPLHVAYEEVCRAAAARGVRVTGTEIVGLVPKQALIEAGRFFLEKAHRSTDLPESDLMQVAVESMRLDDLKPFEVSKRVI